MPPRWQLKACPHCRTGDLEWRDVERAYTCLQCGYSTDRRRDHPKPEHLGYHRPTRGMAGR